MTISHNCIRNRHNSVEITVWAQENFKKKKTQVKTLSYKYRYSILTRLCQTAFFINYISVDLQQIMLNCLTLTSRSFIEKMCVCIITMCAFVCIIKRENRSYMCNIKSQQNVCASYYWLYYVNKVPKQQVVLPVLLETAAAIQRTLASLPTKTNTGIECNWLLMHTERT